MAKSANYGRGDLDANPFYGGEVSEFKGKPYTIISPHGGEFGEGFLPIRSGNVMEDVIEENTQNGGAGMGSKKGKSKRKGKASE
jgi:hypothetical protein